ncbi:MAG: hypothetical protein KVP17_003864 [Porospora cf. gigantea B]|uniref:uncharacterized protein n=1 Tax=Porospora cf. gigantea B TaxID=2853592 RepID=UPI003571A316|nr:MAG: hypothetical protein KVP17_003864 [Porospora cf. gigantea B]
MPLRDLCTRILLPYVLPDSTCLQLNLSIRVAIRDPIGKGAAATVWRGDVLEATSEDKDFENVDLLSLLPREIAVKEIDLRRLKLGSNFEREKAKLRREVSILSKLHHPAIVNLLGVVETEDSVFLLMELVKEGELFTRVVTMKHMTEDQARYALRQITAGLEFVHSSGVMHRDLKLENILVDEEVEPGFLICKIADFGLSKYVCGTDTRSFVGTPQYWAPEVIKASRSPNNTYGTAADLWSLGCILYVLIGGAYPFDEQQGKIESAIMHGRYHFRFPRLAAASEDCKDLIRKLLQVNPDQRLTLAGLKKHPWMIKPVDGPSLPDLGAYGRGNSMTVIQAGPLLAHLSKEPVLRKRASEALTSSTRLEQAFVDDVEEVNVRKTGVVSEANHFQPLVAAMDVARVGAAKPNVAGDARVFDPIELVKLQLSIVKRLQMAQITFRHHATLGRRLEASVREFKTLTTESGLIVHKFDDTCGLVLEVFPDLKDAVTQQVPELALELLEMIHDWCNEMMRDASSMQDRYYHFLDTVNKISETASEVRDPVADVSIATSATSVSPVSCEERVALHDVKYTPESVHLEGHVKRARDGLLDDIEQFKPASAENPAETAHSIVPRDLTADVLDFLFLNQQFTGNYPNERTFVDVEAEDTFDGNENRARWVLLAALEQIKRVDDILNAMRIFWANLQMTIERLLKIREHTGRVIKYSVASHAFQKSFTQRILRYEQFWHDLRELCGLYCHELHNRFPQVFRECGDRSRVTRAYDMGRSQESFARKVLQ